jgi:NAD-dependent SIR2 family protein deacetylase
MRLQTLFHLTCHVCHHAVSVIDFQKQALDVWHCPYCSQPYYGMLEMMRNELVGLMARFEMDLIKSGTSTAIEALRATDGNEFPMRGEKWR